MRVIPDIFETYWRRGDLNESTLTVKGAQRESAASTVIEFFKLKRAEVAKLYVRRHPETSEETILELLHSQVRDMRWSGSDVLLTRNPTNGERKAVILETNSCPSGSKAMPTRSFEDIGNPFQRVLEATVLSQNRDDPNGVFLVLTDKNDTGTTSYAKVLAAATGMPVYRVSLKKSEEFRLDHLDGGISEPTIDGRPIVGVFRYVTQAPWERLPLAWGVKPNAIPMGNNLLACLAGGRNKGLAAVAYQKFNGHWGDEGLNINLPHTTGAVSKTEIIELLESEWNGIGVIKDPFSNAGQGVWTVTTPQELEEFAKAADSHRKYILQALIGNDEIHSNGNFSPLVHVGAPGFGEGHYAYDVRMAVVNTRHGYRPAALYARRAAKPLEQLAAAHSWDVLGTNLSEKISDDNWDTNHDRRIIMTQKGSDKLGLDVGILADIYMQAVMANLAINGMADRLMRGGRFNMGYFERRTKDTSITDHLSHEF